MSTTCTNDVQMTTIIKSHVKRWRATTISYRRPSGKVHWPTSLLRWCTGMRYPPVQCHRHPRAWANWIGSFSLPLGEGTNSKSWQYFLKWNTIENILLNISALIWKYRPTQIVGLYVQNTQIRMFWFWAILQELYRHTQVEQLCSHAKRRSHSSDSAAAVNHTAT